MQRRQVQKLEVERSRSVRFHRLKMRCNQRTKFRARNVLKAVGDQASGDLVVRLKVFALLCMTMDPWDEHARPEPMGQERHLAMQLPRLPLFLKVGINTVNGRDQLSRS